MSSVIVILYITAFSIFYSKKVLSIFSKFLTIFLTKIFDAINPKLFINDIDIINEQTFVTWPKT